MPRFQTLEDIDVRGKRVLLRADLNVPVKGGAVTDATRIDRLAPTIEALIEKGAKVIVMSHFGRPDGRPDPAFSLRPLVAPLSKVKSRIRPILRGRWPSWATFTLMTRSRPRIARMPRLRPWRSCCPPPPAN